MLPSIIIYCWTRTQFHRQP